MAPRPGGVADVLEVLNPTAAESALESILFGSARGSTN